MAETIKNINNNSSSEFELPVDYAIYGGDEKNESEYISPKEVSRESIEKIKQRKIRLGGLALLLSRQTEQQLAA